MLRIVFLTVSLTMMIHSVRSFRPTALVTGSTDGIGVTTAKHLAAKGYNVLVHGRDEKRIETACSKIRQFVNDSSNDGDVLVEPLSCADLSTVHGCEKLAQSVKKVCQEKELHLTVLMNNAGVYTEDLVTTTDGTELTFAVNVVAPFVLTSHLLPELLKSSGSKQSSRIVIASSISQCRQIRDWDDLNYDNAKRSYSAHGAYSESKLLDAMLSNEFAERLQGAGHGPDQITSNSLDPGTVNTKMLLAGWGPCGIDVEDAQDQTYLCSSPDLDGVSGEYFTWRSKTGKSYKARERAKLWSILSDLAPSAAEMWKFNWE
jgi:NAD(P)-dependent dehydrogenase (short-subunit alcohol dehydrogenase family)